MAILSNSTVSRRVSEYKTPPSKVSQEERRQRALDEQKRQRALRVNASRNVDLFSALTLGKDDSDEDETNGKPEEDVAPYSVASFATMLDGPSSAGSNGAANVGGGHAATTASTSFIPNPDDKTKKKGRKGKGRKKGKNKNKYGDACMYAELLDLSETSTTQAWNSGKGALGALPSDLESGYVALAPIPKGKRCLAVSYQFDGDGVKKLTLKLHSRVKGIPFLKFPSPLPPDCILDCILDEHWEETGILHILDIVRWHGQDFMDCEAEFRFWWRDARIAELEPSPPPPLRPAQPTETNEPGGSTSFATSDRSAFPHPFIFLPIPYYTPPLPISTLMQTIIPAARTERTLEVPLPAPSVPFTFGEEGDMDVDSAPANASSVLMANPKRQALIETDGMLLYVSESSYHPGQSPLAVWIPASHLDPDHDRGPVMLDAFEHLVAASLQGKG